jgi:hypothetical protein
MSTSAVVRVVQTKSAFWVVWVIASLASLLADRIYVTPKWEAAKAGLSFAVVFNGSDGLYWASSSALEPTMFHTPEPFHVIPDGQASIDQKVPRAGRPNAPPVHVHATRVGDGELVEVTGSHRGEALWGSRYTVTLDGPKLLAYSFVSDMWRFSVIVWSWFVAMGIGWALVAWLRRQLKERGPSV